MSEPTIEQDAGTVVSESKHLSKIELKRQQIFADRVKRHMNNGKSFEDSVKAIEREDYERLPIERKLQILADGFARDLLQMRQNQAMLADTMDVNFQAFEKMLSKLGLAPEEQKKLFLEAEAEIIADRQARRLAAAAEAKQQEKAQTEADKKEHITNSIDQAGDAQTPDGTQVFGG